MIKVENGAPTDAKEKDSIEDAERKAADERVREIDEQAKEALRMVIE